MFRPLSAIILLACSVCTVTGQEAKSTELKVGSFTFKVAAPWVAKAEPRMMSAGGFTLPGKDPAAPVEVDFYHFGAGGGGGVEPNLKRWQSQFAPGPDGKPPAMEREELGTGEKKALLVTLKGTFLSGPAMSPNKTPMPGYAMLGAILLSPEGDVFIKMTGPEAATLAAKEDLKNMVKAAFAKQG
jgi:hypothetical protein